MHNLRYVAWQRIFVEAFEWSGYDGAAAISDQLRGVQPVGRENFSKSVYVPCIAHALNLA